MAEPSADQHPEAPEREVARDLARNGLVLAPLFLGVSTVVWGTAGLASSALALAIVIVNFLIGAWIITKAASISPELLTGAVLGGYLLRLVVLTIVVLPLRDLDWFHVAPFGITLIGGHLGLLAWETQRVSASLAHPGLKPTATNPFSFRPNLRTRSTSE